MRILVLVLAFWAVLFGEQNRSSLGLENFLGGETGEAGEIELAKIRIENLKALKAELEAQAARLRAKAAMDAPVYVSSDDPQVGELLAQISALKNEIATMTSAENSSLNSSEKKDPRSMQGAYIFSDDRILDGNSTLAQSVGQNSSGNSTLAQNSSKNSTLPKNELYEKECQNDANACYELGVMYELGAKVPKDLAKARALYAKACKGRNFQACNDLGVLFFKNENYSEAEQFFSIACENNIANSCANLARIKAQNGQKDEEKELLKTACENGDGMACNNLGILENAYENFKKSCELKNALGCANFALELDKRAEQKEAKKMLKKACDLGDLQSCKKR